MSIRHDYDAAKRHEYYLRTRKLVGRKKSAEVIGAAQKSLAKKQAAQKAHAQHQKELAVRLTRLKARLEQLQVALKVLTEAAQKRSGVDKNSAEKAAAAKYQRKKSSDPTSKYEKKTPAQKDAAAAAEKKYRDTHPNLETQVHDLNNKIKAIRERIKRLQKTGSV